MIAELLFSTHLEKKEKIYYVAHTHMVTIMKPVIKIIFFGTVIPGIFYIIFTPLKLVWLIWLGIGIIKTFYEIANWYFDAWLITTSSIIDVEWNGFFNKNSTRIDYNALKGVSYSIKGFLGTILNFGTVQLEIFTSNSVVTLPNAHRPKKVEREILKAQGQFVNSKIMSEHESLKTLLATLLEKQVAKK